MRGLPRRLWHIFGGLSVPLSGLWAPQDIFLPSLISITLAAIAVEIARRRSLEVNRRFIFLFGALLRGNESSDLTASTYFLVAASTVFLLCHRSAAALALVFAAVGDPAAGMVGERWGKTWLTREGSAHSPPGLRLTREVSPQVKGKSLEGSLAFLGACLVAGLALVAITDLVLWQAVAGAFCATAVEFLSLRVNDNLSIPLVTAGVVSLLQYLLG